MRVANRLNINKTALHLPPHSILYTYFRQSHNKISSANLKLSLLNY